jgi:aspartate aminotransferase
MPISKKISAIMEKSSWIRRMFEEGAKLKSQLGDENVFDFTLGNPSMDPPAAVTQGLIKLATEPVPGIHGYMPNAGLPQVRKKIAGYLADVTSLGFTLDHIIMTVGAAGGLNVVIKSVCDPGDEVIIAAPYFAEYLFYANNHRAVCKIVETDKNFNLDPIKIEAAINPKTRIVLLNSPNNPTGVVYPEESLKQLGDILTRKSKEHKRPIYLVMDEPYRKLTYDGITVPDIFRCYYQVVVATSHSKDLSLPGERIGYLAISPKIGSADKLAEAMTLSNRILGFVNAPALFQRLVANLQAEQVDMSVYEANRKTLVDGLTQIGYEVQSPGGGFYLFPKTPADDDIQFIAELKNKNILVVPGAGFGRKGYFRIAFCCDNQTCVNSLPGFKEVYQQFH